MTKIISILSVASMIFITSCGKEGLGNDVDFSNSLNPYIEFSSTDPVDVSIGDTVEVAVDIRTAFQQGVTVYYDVSAPLNLKDQTFVIERNSLEAAGMFTIPEDVVLDPSGITNATVTLTKAVTDDGEMLTIGRYNDPSTEAFDVHISQP